MGLNSNPLIYASLVAEMTGVSHGTQPAGYKFLKACYY
jgi:hypothetical protein